MARRSVASTAVAWGPSFRRKLPSAKGIGGAGDLCYTKTLVSRSRAGDPPIADSHVAALFAAAVLMRRLQIIVSQTIISARRCNGAGSKQVL